MSEEKKTVELKEEDLEKVTGGDWNPPDIDSRGEPSEQMKEVEIGTPTHGAGKLS